MEAGALSGYWTATLRKEGFKHLEPGQRYRVAAEFADYDDNIHPAGESWRFLTHSFMPHEDGLSLFVSVDDLREWHIRLQWRPETQAAIIEALDRYLVAC